jgi:hypothetical protein
LQARAEAYAIADLAVDTEGREPDDVVNLILGWLKARPTPALRTGGGT